MAVFRRKVRGRKVKTWTAKFEFLGTPHRKGGFHDREVAKDWIDTTRAALRRGGAGYVRARSAAKIKPLIEDFAKHLRTLKRDDKYVENTENRLMKLASEVPWMTVGDFTEASFEAWRAAVPTYKGKALAPKTLNQYLDHASEFGAWLAGRKILQSNPFKETGRVTVIPNPAFRRAASLDELKALLTVSPVYRAMVYRFVIYIPIRRKALRKIVWGDLQLDGDRPTFTLRAEISKTHREAKMAVPQHLATMLKEWRGDKEADQVVFDRIPICNTIRSDWKAAGVAFDDGAGNRRLDLHAFRKTAIRILKAAGVSLDDAHVFLQHRDRRTTERHYDDDLVAPEITVAAEQMPQLEGKGVDIQRRRGKNRKVGAQTGAQTQSESAGAK